MLIIFLTFILLVMLIRKRCTTFWGRYTTVNAQMITDNIYYYIDIFYFFLIKNRKITIYTLCTIRKYDMEIEMIINMRR